MVRIALCTPLPRETIMFRTIIIILLALWAFGLVIKIGGFLIHLLLVAAAIILVVRLIQGRRLN